MPIFEFSCSECNKDFEELCRKGTSHVECPHCGGKKVHKKISSFAFSTGSGSSSSGPAPVASTKSGCSSCASHSCSTCH